MRGNNSLKFKLNSNTKGKRSSPFIISNMLIKSLNQIEKLKKEDASFSLYFSLPNCGVCQVLKPKLFGFIKNNYPNIRFFHVDTSIYPEVAAQLCFYTNPSFIVYLNGQEYLRRSRSISLHELDENLARLYKLMF